VEEPAVNPVRTRREPPPLRAAAVAASRDLGGGLTAVSVAGAALAGLERGLPGASVRFLLPDPDTGEVVWPHWNGNEFLRPDGTRPLLRTLTPLRVTPTGDGAELDVVVVRHGDAPLTRWVESATNGTPVAVSGTGRGYDPGAGLERLVLVGDESALPAMATVIAATPAGTHVTLHAEVRDPTAPPDLSALLGIVDPDGAPPPAGVHWHASPRGAGDPPGAAMVAALTAEDLDPGDPGLRVWAAGEAASVQAIRKHLQALGVPRSQATVRGYWKVGRAEAG